MNVNLLIPLFSIATLGVTAPAFADQIKQILTDRVEKFEQVVGVATFQLKDGAVTLTTAGFQDAARTKPVTPSTLFEIGSITKTMTALVLADMVIKGELKLDDPVEKFLPSDVKVRDRNDAPIRLIDLATHRSGLPRLSANLVVEGIADPYASYTDHMMFDALRTRAANSKETRGGRDEKFEYSNFGFGLLGVALARRAELSFETLLQRRIFDPLQLRETHIQIPTAQLPMMTNVHNAQRKVVPVWTFDAYAGAGAVRMSIRDLARYAQAALGSTDTPLKEAFALSLKVHGAGANPMNPVGLAWIQAPLNGRLIYTHDGGTYGSASSIFLDPSKKAAGGAFSNTEATISDLALHALDASIPPADLSKTKQVAVNVSPKALGALLGTYQLSPRMDVEVTLREGRLFARATGQTEFELFAKSDRVFFARVTPLEMHFDTPDAQGQSPGFVLHQADQKIPARRKP